MHKFYIKPRQSGKTTHLLKKHIRDYSVSCLIVKSEQDRDIIIKEHCPVSPYKIYSVDDIQRKIRGIIPDVLYIDEYLLFSENQKREVYDIVGYFNYIEVHTTLDKLYHWRMIELIKTVKSLGYGIYILNQEIHKGYKDYDCNLLTHPNFEIITNNDYRKYLTEELFDIEVKGKLYYDEGEY